MAEHENRLAAWLEDRFRNSRPRRTQGQLAQRLEVASSTVSRWVHGEVYPDGEKLPGIAAFFGVPVETVGDLLPKPWEKPARSSVRQTGVPLEVVEEVARLAAEQAAERVLAQVRDLLGPAPEDEMATILQRAGIDDPDKVDDRLPVLFSGVIWEELTDSEKAGVIALAKRLMGRPSGKMGRRRTAEG